MAKISSYLLDGDISLSDKLIGTDGDSNNATKNYRIGDILSLFNDPDFLTGFVPYNGATQNLDLGGYDLYADYAELNEMQAADGYFNTVYQNGYPITGYGQAFSIVTQQHIAVGTPKTVEFEVVSFLENLSIAGNAITFTDTGKYMIDLKARVEHTSGGGDAVLSFWLKYPGPNVTNSRQVYTVANTHVQEISYSFVVDILNSGDILFLQWTTSNLAARLIPTVAATFYPAAPSVALNVYKIG